LLVSLLILPLYVPVLVFGLAATTAATSPEGSTSSFFVLTAIVLVSVVLQPWATAAALRAYLK
jgi:heme exporter protein B